MSSDPGKILLQGAEILRPLFSQHGFAFALLGGNKGCGGPFAYAEYKKGGRRFEFHFRYSLGLVTYHLDADSISHEQYMYSVQGKPGLSRYPGFSEGPLDAFRDLTVDPREHGSEFLEATDEVFRLRIEDARLRWANRPKLPE